MGHHYVPQYYLKGFSVNSGKRIWVYDKQGTLSPFATSPKNVAQETAFYSPEVETYLANHIEYPANKVLAKIRKQQRITENEKDIFAIYMAVMLKRVPGGKDLYEQRMPKVADDLRRELDERLSRLASREPENAHVFERGKEEVREVCDRMSKNPPKDIWLKIIAPEFTPRIVGIFRNMVWRFFTTNDDSTFLTGDNPASYFKFLGLGHAECEVTFPISSHVTLWLTWRRDLTEGYFPATNQIVKEINRRTVSNANRYVYHHVNKDWIQPFVTKRRHQRYQIY